MLEHVAPNQTRFVAPGLAPDTRGIALGRVLTILLPSIDRVVGLFGGISESNSLDELLTKLKILQVITPLRSREFLVQVPVSNSYAADQIAATAALVGGLTFTGTAKHFVKYRDSRAPLGYDVDSLYGGQGEFILYAEEFVQAYNAERAVDFAQMTFNLSLQRDRGDSLQPNDRVVLRVVPGLWRSVLVYLHRNNVSCAAAAGESSHGTGQSEQFFLIRAQALPERMVRLFMGTPGIEVLRLKTERVAIQVGYRHPIEFSSCSAIFAEDRFYLFSGERDRLDILEGSPTFVPAKSLVSLGQGDRSLQTRSATAIATGGVQVPLRLIPVSGARPPVVASRLPVEQAGWLKKLIYMLPPQVLAGYSVCLTDEHLYLLKDSGADYIPLGEMFHAVAPSVMVPVGYQLIPRVFPDILLQHLGASAEQLFFFCLR